MAKQPPAPPKAPPPPAGPSSKASKKFQVAPWTGHGEGEKIILYGPSGMGKTTLASMAPDPVFIGCDDGGRKIVNPKTGEPVLHVPGIETFGDVRDALRSDVFDDHQTIVIDTGTELQHWALPYMFATIKHEKGHTVSSIEGYGYGKGYRHMYDHMHGVLADLDRLVRNGKNVLVLCQEAAMQETNTSGENYSKAGPDLFHTDKTSIRNDYISWSDHVFRITWENAVVDSKKISPVTGRMVNTHPDASFFAKSRGSKFANMPAVSFESPDDDSLWQVLFS
jgi:hypothetical protein